MVPVIANGQVTGVLDIDSQYLKTFDQTDAMWLEKIVKLIKCVP